MDNQPASRQAEVVSTDSRRVMVAEEWRGPIPDPDTLERYESLIPGSGERFFKIFENQVRHRQQLENAEFDRESKRMDWGLVAAFSVVTMIIGAGAFSDFRWSRLGRSMLDWREYCWPSGRVYFWLSTSAG